MIKQIRFIKVEISGIGHPTHSTISRPKINILGYIKMSYYPNEETPRKNDNFSLTDLQAVAEVINIAAKNAVNKIKNTDDSNE